MFKRQQLKPQLLIINSHMQTSAAFGEPCLVACSGQGTELAPPLLPKCPEAMHQQDCRGTL